MRQRPFVNANARTGIWYRLQRVFALSVVMRFLHRRQMRNTASQQRPSNRFERSRAIVSMDLNRLRWLAMQPRVAQPHR